MESLRDITIDLFSMMEEKEKSIPEHENMILRMKRMGADVPEFNPSCYLPAVCMFDIFMTMYGQLWNNADEMSKRESFCDLIDDLRDDVEDGNNKFKVWEDDLGEPYGDDLKFWENNIDFYRALFKITDVMFPYGDSTGFFLDIDDAPWNYSNMCNKLIRIRMSFLP
jgi:hypothetical protein